LLAWTGRIYNNPVELNKNTTLAEMQTSLFPQHHEGQYNSPVWDVMIGRNVANRPALLQASINPIGNNCKRTN
jgi:hypothetical protein